MRIERSEEVRRYFVLFERAEVLILRRIGQLPPTCSIPAPLWLTEAELVETARMLGATNPEREVRDFIEDWSHGG